MATPKLARMRPVEHARAEFWRLCGAYPGPFARTVLALKLNNNRPLYATHQSRGGRDLSALLGQGNK